MGPDVRRYRRVTEPELHDGAVVGRGKPEIGGDHGHGRFDDRRFGH